VAGEPLHRVGERFGFKVPALKSMVCRFRAQCRRGVPPPFFYQTVEDDPPASAAVPTNTAPSCRRLPTAGA
jgi:hypothetical protein